MKHSNIDLLHLKPVLSLDIDQEQGLVTARQRARQLAALLGFTHQDQTRIATAVSEIARNANQYARGGMLRFLIDLRARPQFFWVQVSDRGPGISDLDSILTGSYTSSTGMGLGLAGTSRLMDEFHITTAAEKGTTVQFGKAIPPGSKPVEMADLGQFSSVFAQQAATGAAEELERQNKELLHTLDMLRIRESELERRQHDLFRLNLELEETNRGVLALYAELDEKAEALRRADEMKSHFLSHVSHEFRTPVNAVLALTRLLLDRADGDLSAEQEKQVAYIRDAAQQLADMVNDLLDLAKVESGKTELRLSQIDAAQFLGATRALMRPLANTEGVALIFEEPSHPLVLESDESKLGQILRNLISNALKFTQRGEVRVRAMLSSAQTEIIFTVRDTGIGIAPKDQERIFQEFAQIEHPIQRHLKGTGLGLPLSRKLALLLGGTLAVESAVGVGSTFRLTLPYRVSDSPALSVGEGQAQSNTILVVDDDEASRYLTRRLFEGTRYLVVETSSVEAAERARSECPALIILDLTMPDRSGFEVIEELKLNKTTQHIPVVIHTSKVMTETDFAQLGGRQSAILPKGTKDRLQALLAIRELLGEPHLFSAESEFQAGVSVTRNE